MQIASPASSVLGTGTAGRWTRTSGILCHPIQYHPGQGVVAMIPTRWPIEIRAFLHFSTRYVQKTIFETQHNIHLAAFAALLRCELDQSLRVVAHPLEVLFWQAGTANGPSDEASISTPSWCLATDRARTKRFLSKLLHGSA